MLSSAAIASPAGDTNHRRRRAGRGSGGADVRYFKNELPCLIGPYRMSVIVWNGLAGAGRDGLGAIYGGSKKGRAIFRAVFEFKQ